MKNFKMKQTVAGILVGGLLLGCIAISAAPGDDDPVVLLSYLTGKIIPEIHAYVNEKVDAVLANMPAGDKFKVVSVKNGQTLIAGEGTELILRMGSGTVLASEKGGLSNVTTAVDLGTGDLMPSNSLLIVPLADGRGFTATSEVLIMVKGSYEIV